MVLLGAGVLTGMMAFSPAMPQPRTLALNTQSFNVAAHNIRMAEESNVAEQPLMDTAPLSPIARVKRAVTFWGRVVPSKQMLTMPAFGDVRVHLFLLSEERPPWWQF